MPGVAVEVAVNIRVEEQFGLQLGAENWAETPDGKFIGALKPTVVVEEKSPPGRTAATTVEIVPVWERDPLPGETKIP